MQLLPYFPLKKGNKTFSQQQFVVLLTLFYKKHDFSEKLKEWYNALKIDRNVLRAAKISEINGNTNFNGNFNININGNFNGTSNSKGNFNGKY